MPWHEQSSGSAFVLRNRGHHGCDPQAVLTALRASSGEVFLICDECEACFLHPDRAWALDGPDFLGEHDRRTDEAEYASMNDIVAVGWKARWFFDSTDAR